MGWMDSFAKQEQERKSKEAIEQTQKEYREELEREVSLGYVDSQAELDELKLSEEIDQQIDEAILEKVEKKEAEKND